MRPRPTIRLRLTVWFAAIFLLCGAALLAAGYTVVRGEFGPGLAPRAVPSGAPGAGSLVSRAERPAQVERRVREEVRRRDEEGLREVLGWFAAILGAATVASVAAGWLVAGRALAPVSRITETARTVSGRRLHERIGLAGPHDELKELADTFDAMLSRLDATFESHRCFVANASHELRTPLAIIRAELEELAEAPASAAERQVMVANARRAAARSDRLIASLLALARSEGELQQQAVVDLADLVRRALASERGAAGDDVRVGLDLRPAVVAGDPILLESLVVNLVENGLRHNRPGGHLHVATRVCGEALLSVANTGPPVEPGEVERLFEPFARRGRPRGGAQEGFGLGLSIVRAVATAHGGTVAATAPASGGLAVVVRLPAAEAQRPAPDLEEALIPSAVT